MGALSSIRGFTPDSTLCRGIPHSPARCVALWHHWMPQGFSAAMHLDPGRNSKCLPYLDGSCCFITEKPGAVWTYSCCSPLILLQVWDHLVPRWGSELQSVTARRQRDWWCFDLKGGDNSQSPRKNKKEWNELLISVLPLGHLCLSCLWAQRSSPFLHT